MTYLMSAVLGFVQGVAEFLPISSSGHLTLLQHFFGLQQPDHLFNVLLHFATLLAVCLYYFRDVLEMVREFFGMLGDLFSRRAPASRTSLQSQRYSFGCFLIELETFLYHGRTS